MTREEIEKLNEVEPYCFETDKEEQWYKVGLQKGLSIADANPKSHWISITDDLPCNHEELITTDGFEKKTIYVITVDRYGIVEENYMVLSDDCKWEWKYDAVPLYWMLIPKLPKEIED